VKYEIIWLCKILNEYGKRPLFAEFFLKETALNTSSTIQETLRVLRTLSNELWSLLLIATATSTNHLKHWMFSTNRNDCPL